MFQAVQIPVGTHLGQVQQVVLFLKNSCGVWGEEVDEDELVKAAIERSLNNQKNKTEDIELLQLIEDFQKETIKPNETCTVVVLQKKLMQTCMRAIQETSFDFRKMPCIGGAKAPRKEYSCRICSQSISRLTYNIFENREFLIRQRHALRLTFGVRFDNDLVFLLRIYL